MKISRTILFILTLSCLLISCNQKQKSTPSETAKISKTMQVDDLLNNAEGLVGETVVVDGVCTHICRHGGKKIFLMGSDDTQIIRVEASDNIGSFSQETVNSIVEVKGILMEQRIDEAYLVDWETRLAAGTAEEHGDGEEGCATEQKAQNEQPANTEQERIANFRERIAERNEKEGKNFLSFYFIEAEEYTIQ
ncbi:MAG TPA: hypothetical protein GXX67_03840 [Petrimonas sp.]|jgi:RecJ-like exonuclease|nr:hypothetical protein [Petrimonas sp.]